MESVDILLSKQATLELEDDIFVILPKHITISKLQFDDKAIEVVQPSLKHVSMFAAGVELPINCVIPLSKQFLSAAAKASTFC